MFTFEDDEWVALAKRTQETLEINGDTNYYRPKANTEESTAVCIITRKGEYTLTFDIFSMPCLHHNNGN